MERPAGRLGLTSPAGWPTFLLVRRYFRASLGLTMKFLLCSCFALVAIASAAPEDAELLKLVRERKSLERVTAVPYVMAPAAAALCKSPGSPGPHGGAEALVYANDPAALPVFDPWGKFPVGSLLLKEKISKPGGETELFTGMWKREAGYFPELGDWEFFTVDAKAEKVLERGKLESCAACHRDYTNGDFITKLYAAPTQLTHGRIVLHSSKATPHGEKLQYEPIEKKNTLGFWVNAADWAEWKFVVAQPGTFTIHLWQGCGTGSGGAEVVVVCNGQTNTFTVKDTGHFQNFEEREIGEISFKEAGPQTLELHAKTKPGVAVMDCRQIILVPKKAP